LTHVPLLLEQVRDNFVRLYGEDLKTSPYKLSLADDFGPVFNSICEQVEKHHRSVSTDRKPKKGTESKAGKTGRDWGDKISKADIEALDLSPSPTIRTGVSSTDDLPKKAIVNLSKKQPEAKNQTSMLSSFVNRVSGQQELTVENLEDARSKMYEQLIQKNVAAEVAQHVCKHVVDSLLGKRLGTFDSAARLVRTVAEDAIAQVLEPDNRKKIELVEEIKETIKSRRPYVLAFVGVNGVGKSTSLAKVCYRLLENHLSVLIVAGDTFRSGAVEQLQVHVHNLSQGRREGVVRLFERGYGKDAAAIAKDAIIEAARQNIDVVLIDTAGRMQDNRPLMQALAKLVKLNRPDKLVFVGEALVGNEAVDQLRKFNAALCDSSENTTRIDGILLTKFDTIDEKVGAALSMSFISRAPILYIGVGQTYADLKPLDISEITDSLFSS